MFGVKFNVSERVHSSGHPKLGAQIGNDPERHLSFSTLAPVMKRSCDLPRNSLQFILPLTSSF